MPVGYQIKTLKRVSRPDSMIAWAEAQLHPKEGYIITRTELRKMYEQINTERHTCDYEKSTYLIRYIANLYEASTTEMTFDDPKLGKCYRLEPVLEYLRAQRIAFKHVLYTDSIYIRRECILPPKADKKKRKI